MIRLVQILLKVFVSRLGGKNTKTKCPSATAKQLQNINAFLELFFPKLYVIV